MTRKVSLAACGLILFIGAQGQWSYGITVELPASQDNTMYEEGQLSNGSGPVMFVGNNAGESSRRALIQFDIAGEIPSGATITSVTLTLYMAKSNDVADANLSLHRVEVAWGEGASSAGGGPGGGQGGGGGAPAEPGDAT